MFQNKIMYTQVGNILKKSMPTNVHSLKDYKAAKTYVVHLTAIIKVVDLTIKGLAHFEVYTSVKNILITLRNERIILEANLRKYRRIVNAKGGNENG